MVSLTLVWGNRTWILLLLLGKTSKITQGTKKGTKRQAKTKLIGGIWHPPLADTAFLAWHITVKFFQTSPGVYLDSGGSFMKVKLPLYTVVHPGKLGAHQNPSYTRLWTSHTHLQLEETYFCGLYGNSRNINLTIGNPSSLI